MTTSLCDDQALDISIAGIFGTKGVDESKMKKIKETIKKLIAEHGIGIFEQENRLIAILADLHPEEKRNRYLIGLSLRADIPKKLLSLNNDDADNKHKISSIKHFFKEEFFLEDGAVKLVFECLIEALMLTKESYIENTSGLNFKMMAIKGGTFLMGSNDGFYDERPVHNVTVSDFYMAENLVSQALWEAIMGNNPSNFKGDNLPVVQVSWDDVQDFLSKLNIKTGKIYRLPTEAEWEYAAGDSTDLATGRNKYAGTNDEINLGDYAWYYANSNDRLHPVGTKQPNSLGLYDLSGNVLEWCNDWYSDDYYAISPQNNPKGASTGSYRLVRGGCRISNAQQCRSAGRGMSTPGGCFSGLGLRLALVP